MTGHVPGGPVADTGREMAPPASGLPGRRVIAVMLLAAAVLGLAGVASRWSARHAGPTVGLVVAGVAAAVLSLRTAHACESRRRWPAWAAHHGGRDPGSTGGPGRGEPDGGTGQLRPRLRRHAFLVMA